MVRSVFAVLLGWAAVGVLVVFTDLGLSKLYPDQYVAGKLPPDYLAGISLATSTLWSIAGGYITAMMAKDRPWRHLLGLVVWGELMGIASAISTWGMIQNWYQIGLLLLWAPAVAVGCWLRVGRPKSAGGA